MKYSSKEAFEKDNMFGTGRPMRSILSGIRSCIR